MQTHDQGNISFAYLSLGKQYFLPEHNQSNGTENDVDIKMFEASLKWESYGK